MRNFLFVLQCISFAVTALKSITGLIMTINSKQKYLTYRGR